MNRKCKGGLIILVVLIAAQFVRPNRANPASDAAHAIGASSATLSGVAPILERSCGDCHSNHTTWPWYTRVAPLSWLMSHGVKEGRKVLNISEWSAYPPEVQQGKLLASCRAVTQGKMPGGAWTMLHPEAKLSQQEIQLICAAARTAEVPNAQ